MLKMKVVHVSHAAAKPGKSKKEKELSQHERALIWARRRAQRDFKEAIQKYTAEIEEIRKVIPDFSVKPLRI